MFHQHQNRRIEVIFRLCAELLFASFSIGCTSSEISKNERADQVIVLKSQHSMTLLSRGT